ncbi:MAG: peptidoglycan-binding protein, partial [Clostridia bacterium]|nr:peptidoglycan-binding protein [Clostridia bacterium]
RKDGSTYSVSSFFTTVKLGSKGDAVKTLQTKLKKLGYKGKDGKELSYDGAFGTNTDFALRAFQKAKGLSADGIAGPKTWAVL